MTGDTPIGGEPAPVFNPTDFFRETIFTTDFMGVGAQAAASGHPQVQGDGNGAEMIPVAVDLLEPSGFFDLEDD